MHPVISSFTTLMSLAFVSGGIVMQRDFARKGIRSDLAWTMVLAGMAGGLVGAHGEYVLQHWEELRATPLVALTSWSGLVWYGGVLGGVLATAWPIRRAGIAWASAADSAAPALALGLAIARIGCHLAGDGDWGTPTTLPWAVAYTDGVSPWPHPPGVAVHPAALYESAGLALVSIVLWRLRARLHPAGAVFALYLVLSGALRFGIEAIRTNPPLLWSLSEAQWISAALVGAGASWLVVTHRAWRGARAQPRSPAPRRFDRRTTHAHRSAAGAPPPSGAARGSVAPAR